MLAALGGSLALWIVASPFMPKKTVKTAPTHTQRQPAPPMPVVDVAVPSHPSDPLVWVTRENYWGALTKRTLSRAVRMAAEGDKAAVREMLDSGNLFIVKPGVRVYVQEIEEGYVRVRVKGKSLEFWTVREAISKP